MEVIQIAQQILHCIKELDALKVQQKTFMTNAVTAEVDYENQVSKMIMRLRNGEEIEHEEIKIKNPPATVLDKIVRGITWQDKLRMTTAQAELKALQSNIMIEQSKLNGYKVIYQHLSEA